jgi:hypothetical protein
MILTTHILSGAALGTSIQNPVAVAGLSVILHFLLDALPHGDYLNKKSSLWSFWKVAIDLMVGFSIAIAILFCRGLTSTDPKLMNIGIGIFFSLLPDGLTFLCLWMGMKFLRPIYAFHNKLHRAPDFSPEREFRFKNNLFDILISLTLTLFLLK